MEAQLATVMNHHLPRRQLWWEGARFLATHPRRDVRTHLRGFAQRERFDFQRGRELGQHQLQRRIEVVAQDGAQRVVAAITAASAR